MGAHSAIGRGSGPAVTTAAGLAAAVVTTAATGLLTGGTALASAGSGHGGPGHSHGSRSSDGHARGVGWGVDGDSDDAESSEPAGGLAVQTLCDVMGDVAVGDGSACAPGDDSSDAPADGTSSPSVTSAAPAAAPRPAPRPTSSVPDHPTIQPIVAPPSGRRVVPIATG